MSEIKKIIVASGTYGTEVSGQATFAQNFIREYSALHPEIAIIQVVYGSDQSDSKLHYVRRGSSRFLRYFWTLLKLQDKHTIFFAQDLISSGLPAALASWVSGRKLFIRLGGDFLWEKMLQEGRTSVPLEDYYNQKKNIKERIFLFVYRFVLGRAKIIIFNTYWQRDFYSQVFGLTKDRTAVIENVTELSPVTAVDQGNQPTTTFLFIGRFIVMKNLRRLIEAFRLIKIDTVRLKLYGYGPELELLKKMSADDSRITIAGPMQGIEKENIIRQADVVANVSLTDIYPHFVLEALAHCKPVILTRHSYLPPAVKDACLLIDPLQISEIQLAMERYTQLDQRRQSSERISRVSVPSNWAAAVRNYDSILHS